MLADFAIAFNGKASYMNAGLENTLIFPMGIPIYTYVVALNLVVKQKQGRSITK